MTLAGFISVAGAAVWVYLLGFRGMFWRLHERDDADAVSFPEMWPSVAAIVPARDEIATIERAVGSLLVQDYPGEFRIVVVDDQSSDDTGPRAQALDGNGARLEVLRGTEPPSGWTGKLWALKQGVVHAGAAAPDYLWFTDADIVHSPDNLRRLVARAETGRRVMVSLMARLRCESFAEQVLIPAYVFFFAMLFPFSRVNRPGDSTAAAAGGCILLDREALERAGGIDSIRGEIIDDCALSRRMKKQGAIWLGLTERAVSVRPYPHMRDIRRLIARSAYAQLGYSPLLLMGTLAGMFVIYGAPPFIAMTGSDVERAAAGLSWLLMSAAFQPVLHFYRRSPLWGVALPLIGLFYAAFTLDSAIQFWRGRGGMWKGRIQTVTRQNERSGRT
jgi:hopene-associated glycosyltransferase HpnB